MNNLKLATGLSGGFGVVGGFIGYSVNGIKGATDGFKVGAALGTQTALLVDGGGENTNKALVDKKENTAEKIEINSDQTQQKQRPARILLDPKTRETIQKACNIGTTCIVNIADVWSKLALTGYAIQIGFSGAQTSFDSFNTNCNGMVSSINCLAMAATNTSANALLTISFICITAQVLKITCNVKGENHAS